MPEQQEIEAADVLDVMANPHPRMWREAQGAYGRATADNGTWIEKIYWEGYMAAMCAATGYEPEYFINKLEAEIA